MENTLAKSIGKLAGSIERILIALRTRQFIDHLNENVIPPTNDYYKFDVIHNRKYSKVILLTTHYGGHDSKSAWCFIDRTTGDVYKPASWKRPILKSGARFNLYDDDSMHDLFESADVAGRCLYKKNVSDRGTT